MGTKTVQAKQVPIDVVGSSSFGVYDKISPARTYNMIITTSPGNEPWLVSFPAYRRVFELFGNIGEGRAIYRSIRGNFLIVIINSFVYRFDTNLAPTLIGALETNTGEISIAENLNSQVCIVDGLRAYIYNSSLPPNLTVQALGGGLIPNYVDYHNTFFLFGNGDRTSNGSAWFVYSFATPTTITQTAQLALQTKSDFAIAILKIPSQAANVLVFGTSVCEIHTQIAGLLPYRRNNTYSIDYGCISTSTIATSDRYIVWLAINQDQNPVIMVFSNEGAVPISTDGIDKLMSNIKFPDESTAMFIRVFGHLVYQLTFFNEQDNLTICYDFDTKKFYDLSDQHLNYHPARNYAFFNNTNYFVSLNNASIYEIDPSITFIDESINGSDPTKFYPMQSLRVTSNFKQPDSDKFIARLLVLMIEQGNDPRVTHISLAQPPIQYQPRVDLSLSKDDGVSWSVTVPKGMNAVGRRQNIMNWNSLGAANCLSFKFRFWGLDRFVVQNAIMEAA